MLRIIGHRGAKGLAPENTLASIRKALEYNVYAVEFDIHTSKDGRCAIFHDPAIPSQDAVHALIAGHTYKELQDLHAELTSFEDVIKVIDRRSIAWAEVKPGADPKPIIAIVKQFLAKGWQPTDFVFASFSQSILREIHAALPDIPIAINEEWSSVRAARRAKELGTDIIVMNQLFLWWGVVGAMSKRGYKLSTFTINNPRKAKRWHDRGLYAACTDFPDRFKEVK